MRGLLLLNYDNVYNMLYPFYYNQINKYEFNSNNVNGVLQEFEEQTSQLKIIYENIKQKLASKFIKNYDLEYCSLTDKIYSEKWVKYSETGNEWRFYSMDFYRANSMNDVDKLLS